MGMYPRSPQSTEVGCIFRIITAGVVLLVIGLSMRLFISQALPPPEPTVINVTVTDGRGHVIGSTSVPYTAR